MTEAWTFRRDVDPLALLAALVSLATLVQVFVLLMSFVRGPDVLTYPPDAVSLIRYHYLGRSKPYLRVAALRSYFNQRGYGRSDLLAHERLLMTVDSKRYSMVWSTFENFQPNTATGTYSSIHTENIHLKSIPAAAAVSHETFYAAARNEDFLRWEDFLAMLYVGERIEFEFEADLSESGTLRTICSVAISDGLRSDLEVRGFAVRPCESTDLDRPILVESPFWIDLSFRRERSFDEVD